MIPKITKLVSFALGVAILIAIPASSFASVPDNFVYEGRLLDSAGAPMTSAKVFRFSFWSSSDFVAGDINGAGAINVASPNYGGWQEVQAVSFNSSGVFSLEIGSATPLPSIDYTKHRFLQVEIKNVGDPDTSFEVMDPTGDNMADTNDRETIGSVPYSKIAEATNEENFILDKNDTVLGAGTGTVRLQFGSLLGKYLEYDFDNSRFNFNDSVKVSGNFIVTGMVDHSGATGFVLREDPDPASNSSCSRIGELIYDTTDLKLQHCKVVGGAGVASWEDVGVGAGSHMQNTDIGTTSNDFTLDKDDSGGVVRLVFGDTVNEFLAHDGTNFYFTDDLLMQNDKSIQFRDSDLNINSSIDGQLDINADTELEINAPTVDLNGDLDISGNITGATIDGDNNTITNLDKSMFKTFSTDIRFEPEYPNTSVYDDGSNNSVSLFGNYDAANGRQYYVLSSNDGAIQDLDLVVSIKLPDDFVSFDVNPLQLYIRSLTNNLADNYIDLTLRDTSNNPVLLVGGANLVSSVVDTWELKNVTFGGAPAFVAGENIVLDIKLHTNSAGKMYSGTLIFNYITH